MTVNDVSKIVTIFSLICFAHGGLVGIRRDNRFVFEDRKTCEPITEPLCMAVGYNNTYTPTPMLHTTQLDAANALALFRDLLNYDCSPYLNFFLCSVYMPICMGPESDLDTLPPCREVCEATRDGCVPLMLSFGFNWPGDMDCNQYPRKPTSMNDPLCFDPPPEVLQRQRNKKTQVTFWVPETTSATTRCRCRDPLVPHNHSTFGGVENCVSSCHSPYFPHLEDRQFTTVWIGVWSCVGLLLSTASIVTFLLRRRLAYPERPIIYLALCHAAVSLGYLLRVAIGHEMVSCAGSAALSQTRGSNPACLVIFLLTYFFSLAGALWWMLLTVCWTLSAAGHWSREAIQKRALTLHLVAWVPPFFMTSLAVLIAAIDGDPISGLCAVGVSDTVQLMYFLILPLGAALSASYLCLGAAVISLLRVRNVFRHRTDSDCAALNTYILRVCSFSALYLLPATASLVCVCFELAHSSAWQTSITCGTSPSTPPSYSVFMVRHFAALSLALVPSFWSCSAKSANNWRSVCGACCPVTGEPFAAEVAVTKYQIRQRYQAPLNPYTL